MTEILSLFKEVYPNIKEKGLKSFDQISKAKGSFHYARELDPASMIDLDTKYTARELINIIRARTSSSAFPSSFFYDNNQKYRVKIFIEKDN